MRWAALRTVTRLAALLGVAGCFPAQSYAEVRVQVDPGQSAKHHIAISGRIDLFTLYSFARVMNDPRLAENKRKVVKLDSEGGSVTAAMAVGHIIRDQGFVTGVDRNGRCLSACVLLLAAGTERLIASRRVGVHRPRADLALMAPSTTRQVKASYGEIVDSMRDYLKVMGMSDGLFAAMLGVPSDRMRMLTHRETVAFGLRSKDDAAKSPAPYAHEPATIRSARRPGTAGKDRRISSGKLERVPAQSVRRQHKVTATRGSSPPRSRSARREGSGKQVSIGRRARVDGKIKVNGVANFGAGVVSG